MILHGTICYSSLLILLVCLAPRRITNRESARRMRLKRQEEWGVIKRQVLAFFLPSQSRR